MAQAAPEFAPTGPGLEQAEAGVTEIGKSPGQLFWRRFRQDRYAIAGLVVIVVMVALALGAPLVANLTGHGPNDQFAREVLDEFGLPEGPSWTGGAKGFLMGADEAGRDVFVRVIFGARTSLLVAFLSTGLALVIGVTFGMLAGFYRGKVDTFLSRMMDVVMSLPVLLLALGLVAACGASKEGCLGGFVAPGLGLIAMVIGLFNWPYIARIVRGQVMSLREKEFIEAARAQGSGNLRIMSLEVLPNLVAPIIVYSTLIIPNNILFEAALSFLGVGVPIQVPSWGKMLDDANGVFTVAWWMMLFPGLFLFLTTLAFNLVGDGLRDALDPKTAKT